MCVNLCKENAFNALKQLISECVQLNKWKFKDLDIFDSKYPNKKSDITKLNSYEKFETSMILYPNDIIGVFFNILYC